MCNMCFDYSFYQLVNKFDIYIKKQWIGGGGVYTFNLFLNMSVFEF